MNKKTRRSAVKAKGNRKKRYLVHGKDGRITDNQSYARASAADQRQTSKAERAKAEGTHGE